MNEHRNVCFLARASGRVVKSPLVLYLNNAGISAPPWRSAWRGSADTAVEPGPFVLKCVLWFKGVTYELDPYEPADGAPQLTYAEFIPAVRYGNSTVGQE